MTTCNPSMERNETFELPLDLGEWVDRHQLLSWIEEAVGTLDWNHPEVVAYLQRNPNFRPRMLLTLLAFAYATGIFGSEDIADRCETDPLFRSLCDDRAPTAAEVNRFRRENRGLLKGVLVPTFARVVREKFALGDLLLPPGLKRWFVQHAVERLDLARHTDCAEV